MLKKSKYSKYEHAYSGYLEDVPSNKGSSLLNESTELQIKARDSYKDEYGGCSSNFTENYKAGEFVEKSTGRLGYKQEAKFTSTDKYVDKELGFTAEYQTQVKFKKSLYPNKTQVKFKKSAYPIKSTSSNKNNNHINYY